MYRLARPDGGAIKTPISFGQCLNWPRYGSRGGGQVKAPERREETKMETQPVTSGSMAPACTPGQRQYVHDWKLYSRALFFFQIINTKRNNMQPISSSRSFPLFLDCFVRLFYLIFFSGRRVCVLVLFVQTTTEKEQDHSSNETKLMRRKRIYTCHRIWHPPHTVCRLCMYLCAIVIVWRVVRIIKRCDIWICSLLS